MSGVWKGSVQGSEKSGKNQWQGPAELTLNQNGAQRRDTISAIFSEQRALPHTRSVFFSQPEVRMIYERLEQASLAVREQWTKVFPPGELERVALEFGISFD